MGEKLHIIINERAKKGFAGSLVFNIENNRSKKKKDKTIQKKVQQAVRKAKRNGH